LGQFAEGWDLYEWRWNKRNKIQTPREFDQPLWLGDQELVGKTMLLHAEQGLGDTIQFCRYAKKVKALGARVVLEVQRPLLHLLESLEWVDELVVKGEQLPSFDYHCPLMSLPLAFKTELESIPSEPKYLYSDASKRQRWEQRLGPKNKPRVGLVWSGSVGHKNDRNRSIALEELLKHLPGHCEYVSLQKEVRPGDQEVLAQSQIKHFGEHLDDFAETLIVRHTRQSVVLLDEAVQGALNSRSETL